MELLLGCGGKREKYLHLPDKPEWTELITLDINADHKPDYVHDLNDTWLDFEDNQFDEIHAYEVLEHVGRQGDWQFFFKQWTEFYRILKPGGMFFGTSPHWESVWAWGDPGHTRIVSGANLTYLNQQNYVDQVGKTPMTDYRWMYKADLVLRHNIVKGDTYEYVLEAIKPSRIKP